MTIEQHIGGVFRERLTDAPCLVIYDADRRYGEIALRMADAHISVVDAGAPVFQARDQAMERWLSLPEDPEGRLVVYVPRPKPVDTDAKLVDPYLVFRVAGAVFPEGASDEYPSLCQQAFPERRDQVSALFQDGMPSFAAVNALQVGPAWPRLRTILRVDSTVEILSILLSPSPEQRRLLEADADWIGEARELSRSVLGFAAGVGEVSLSALDRVLWTHVLFSEFAKEVAADLPVSLRDVPRAPDAAAGTVRRLCDSLRTNVQSQGTYIEQAERVERELGLADRAHGMTDLGAVETFPFQNARTFKRLCTALLDKRIEYALDIEQRNAGSLWLRYSSRHQQAWRVAVLARDLLSRTGELSKIPGAVSPGTTGSAVALYVARLSQIDRCHLSLHQAWAEVTDDDAFGQSLHELVQFADTAYRAHASSVQEGFVAAVVASSWPADGVPRQTDVFDRYVAPALAKGERTAYVLVDALRFDLADDVRRLLSGGFVSEVAAACAQLPTKTEVCMSALLPQVAGKLAIGVDAGALAVSVAGDDVTTAARRDDYYRRKCGDRCAVMTMDELLAMGPRKRLPDHVTMVVVRDTGIDDAGEADGMRLPAAIPGAVTQIGKAVHKLRSLGVRRAVITADHGFIYTPGAGPGDVVAKPSGDWEVEKDRFLLGHGPGSPHTIRFAPSEVGVPCAAEAIVFPRGLSAFQSGLSYCHGGLSLQECVVPVIRVEMPEQSRRSPKLEIGLKYRGKTTGRITARVFTVDLSLAAPSLFAEAGLEDSHQVLLVAHGRDVATEVGAVTRGDHVDPSTLLVRISSGETIKVPIRMDDAFRGPFTVKAQDPVTLTRYAEVNLETDYME